MTVRIWCFNAHGLKLYEMRNLILASVFCLYIRAEPRRDLTFSREQPEQEGHGCSRLVSFFFFFFPLSFSASGMWRKTLNRMRLVFRH